MRLLFLLLLLLNAGFFAWQYRQPAPADTGGRAAPPATDPGVSSLTLLSEREPQERDIDMAAAAPERQPQPEPAPPPVIKVCAVVGPYSERAVAEQARTRAAAGGDLEAAVGETQVREHIGYWVRMPDELTIGAARGLLREFKSKGVRDVSIVPLEEEGRYMLSLGVFSREETMGKRRRALRRLGHEPEVVDRFRTSTAYEVRLAYEGREEAEVQAVLEELTEGNSKLRQETVACR